MDGWIKLHRQLQENSLWTSEPFTRGQAWVDLILLANHKYGYFYLRNHKIEVKRGQVGWSILKLAERWSWSRSKVNKFLKDLEKEQQVKQQQSKSTTIITLVNYEEYQKKEQQPEQQQDNRRATGEQQEDTNKKKEENVNNYKYNKFYDEQIKESKDDVKYTAFVEFLFGNNILDKPLNKVLKMSDQIKYKRLDSLLNVYTPAQIKEKILGVENATKKYNSLNLTITNWLKQ